MAKEQLREYLAALGEAGGSDLHLKVGSPPRFRVGNALRKLDAEPLTPEFTAELAAEIMRDHHIEIFERRSELDFAYSARGIGRFRVSAFRQRGSVGLIFHRISTNAVSLDELGFPGGVRALAEETKGLVVVAGLTGSGKTTTMAAMVDHINRTREVHIVTIEDPIEVIHADELASISQRELGFDTADFPSALTAALHQDPDVILVGELRDQDTVSLALAAAESGHLVITSLPTPDATATINRIVDFFPSTQHQQIRARLAITLRGTVCQRLVPRIGPEGRVAVMEVMAVHERIRPCIMDPQAHNDLHRFIAEGEVFGMQTFDQSFTKLYQDGVIELQTAVQAAGTDPNLLTRMQGRDLLAPAPGTAA